MNSAAAVIFLCFMILLCGMICRKPVFDLFREGAAEGLRSAIGILPALIGLMAMTAAFRASGLAEILSSLLLPLAEKLGFPPELLPLTVLRPISGSGALSYYQNLLTRFGADSTIGRLGGIIQGCGETVFYVAALYFGKNGKYAKTAIFCALLGNLVGIAAAVWYLGKIF